MTLALPWLDAMCPAFATRTQAAEAAPQRFLAVNNGLGFHGPLLFPKQAGKDYAASPYLELLKEHREHFTVISRLSHVEQNGANGHTSAARRHCANNWRSIAV